VIDQRGFMKNEMRGMRFGWLDFDRYNTTLLFFLTLLHTQSTNRTLDGSETWFQLKKHAGVNDI